VVTPNKITFLTGTDAALAIALRKEGWSTISAEESKGTSMRISTKIVGLHSAEDAAAPGGANVSAGQGVLGAAPPGQYRATGQGMHS